MFANSPIGFYVARCLTADKETYAKEQAMSEPIKLATFCGSLRKASFNRMALQAFTERLPAGVSLSTIEIGEWQ